MKISDELIADYLEGNTNKEQTLQVLQALKTDAELRELINIAMEIDDEIGEMPVFIPNKSNKKHLYDVKSPIIPPIFVIKRDIIPMMQLAAKDDENICSVACEGYILKRREIPFEFEELVRTAREKHWLKTEGTPLYAIGQLLALKGLLITRKYDASIEDLIRVLALNNDVIVAVDIEKLYVEQPLMDENVNHAVVVTDVNVDERIISIFDPQKNAEISIPLYYFQRAWNDSHNYMVRVLKSIHEYEPEPIHTDEVDLSDNLIELREAIAENVHDVWAIARMKEGWTYGPVRDDEKKQHPDLVPYCALPDSEKEYDRLMAWNTLKLVKKLGFEIKMP